jgi:hypothetical protein
MLEGGGLGGLRVQQYQIHGRRLLQAINIKFLLYHMLTANMTKKISNCVTYIEIGCVSGSGCRCGRQARFAAGHHAAGAMGTADKACFHHPRALTCHVQHGTPPAEPQMTNPHSQKDLVLIPHIIHSRVLVSCCDGACFWSMAGTRWRTFPAATLPPSSICGPDARHVHIGFGDCPHSQHQVQDQRAWSSLHTIRGPTAS